MTVATLPAEDTGAGAADPGVPWDFDAALAAATEPPSPWTMSVEEFFHEMSQGSPEQIAALRQRLGDSGRFGPLGGLLDAASIPFAPIPLSQARPEPPVRTVVDRILLADLNGLMGDGGSGKSGLAYYLAVCVSARLPVFGQFSIDTPADHSNTVVIITSGEEGASLARNRSTAICQSAGLSPEETFAALENIEIWDEGFNLDDTASLRRLQLYLDTHEVSLLIFDPIADLIGDKADTLSDRDARRIYRNIRRYCLAGRPWLGVLIIGHTIKHSGEKTKRQRVFGSAAWTNGLRACWFVERTTDGLTMDSAAKTNRWATSVCHRITRTIETEADGTTWRSAAFAIDENPFAVVADLAATLSEDVTRVLQVLALAPGAPGTRDLENLVKGTGIGGNRSATAIQQAKVEGLIASPAREGRGKMQWTLTETGRAVLAGKGAE